MVLTVTHYVVFCRKKNTSKSAYFNDIIINEAKTENDTNKGNFRYSAGDGETDADGISMSSMGKNSTEKSSTENELKVEDTNITGNVNLVYEDIV